ncbi:unnamed protein product [Pleuronectes platessa]|uniref:Uncharacterized protein n=1 Tax=Pleuronectes platessa TaxID=8262 RepID=A0A9N7VR29_PLEPL|nr:unnamed protein product [Pleuronectes platessa]
MSEDTSPSTQEDQSDVSVDAPQALTPPGRLLLYVAYLWTAKNWGRGVTEWKEETEERNRETERWKVKLRTPVDTKRVRVALGLSRAAGLTGTHDTLLHPFPLPFTQQPNTPDTSSPPPQRPL